MRNNRFVKKLSISLLFISFSISSLFLNVNPIKAAECTDGQEVLSSNCTCSPPKGYPFAQTSGGDIDRSRRYCVPVCSEGDTVFSGGIPSCFCAGNEELIINTNGQCVTNLPDCNAGDNEENCSCRSPLVSVIPLGSDTGFCVDSCSRGQEIYDNAGDPTCSCNLNNYNGFCVSECANNQLVTNNAGETVCFCEEEVSKNRCVLENGAFGGSITNADFDALNPLKRAAKQPGTGDISNTLTTPGAIISRLLEFSFPLAGLILFVMLFWGGFEITYGASTSKSMEAGKNRITAALIGFFLLFSSYWIIQILEEILGITVFL